MRDPRRILDDHLADSLVALEVPATSAARQVADIGSGAGLPGLPLAIARPQADFVLVESAARKCRFIERVVGACGLTNVTVVQSRAESWEPPAPGVDIVTCRAVAGLEVVVEYAAPLLRPGGRLLAWRGARDLQAEGRAARAGDLLGLRSEEVQQVRPYPGAHDRYLHLFLKVMETPSRFPRRPGMAVKRPLGG